MTGQLTLHHGQNRQRTWCASTAISPGGVEPLWSPVVATGGNQRQIGRARKRRKQAQTVAVGCDRLPATFHGKEGVDGSSPLEGSAKAAHTGLFLSGQFADSGTCGRYGALY